MNSSAPGATRAARQHRADAEVIGRRERQRDARADQAAAFEVVVARVAAAVGQRERSARSTKVSKRVDRAGVAAAVGHVAQRREVAAVVALRAVGQADVVAVPRRRARRVLAGDDPRRDVALRQRARAPSSRRARRPARRARDRRVVREVVGGEQLLRRVERSGRQQVDLAGERRRREEVATRAAPTSCVTRPNTFCAAEAVPSAGASSAATIVRERSRPSGSLRRAWRRRHASLAVIVVAGRTGRGGRIGRAAPRSGASAHAGGEHRTRRRRVTASRRSRGGARSTDDARPLGRTSMTCAARGDEAGQVRAQQIRPGDSVRISKRPLRSLTANAVEAPSAETVAPATGAPCSSCTMP